MQVLSLSAAPLPGRGGSSARRKHDILRAGDMGPCPAPPRGALCPQMVAVPRRHAKTQGAASGTTPALVLIKCARLPCLGDVSEVPSLHHGPQAVSAPKVAAGQVLSPPQRALRWLLAPRCGSTSAWECAQTTPTGPTMALSPSHPSTSGPVPGQTNPTWCDISSMDPFR